MSRQSTSIGRPPPYDPELAEVLGPIIEMIPNVETYEEIVASRTASAAIMGGLDLTLGGAFTRSDAVVPADEYRPDIPLLVLRPKDAVGTTPCILFIHGGAMISGDRTSMGPELLEWAQALGCTIVSVEYRLAPETPHPGPVDDCFAALAWVNSNAHELGIDPHRLVLAGVSAGGGLAAGVALMVRHQGVSALRGLMLLAPMLDDRADTPSWRTFSEHAAWESTPIRTGWNALLGGSRGETEVSEYAAPGRALDLRGLAPTYLDVGSAETFRDEVVAFARRIWRAGGNADLHVFEGGFHGYFGMAPQARVSKNTQAVRLNWLERILNS